MEVSSPLVQNSSDPKSNSNSDKLNSSRELISKNQPVINNNNNKHHYHRSTNPQVVGQQSQARLHSSRHQSSSCSQERKEEGCRRVAGDKQHVQHLIQSSNTLLSASQSSPSLNLINNGKNQTQLSTSTNNFNVMKAEQFEMIRKRQYRVGLNLFNKNPPEVSSIIYSSRFPFFATKILSVVVSTWDARFTYFFNHFCAIDNLI